MRLKHASRSRNQENKKQPNRRSETDLAKNEEIAFSQLVIVLVIGLNFKKGKLFIVGE